MAVETHGVPTFPVWVGSLKDTIKEKDLLRVCFKYGAIASCKVMRDEHGKSRRFGYVNFYSEADAERAAEKLAGFLIQGMPLKTKGPRLLQAQGHFSVLHHTPVAPQVNYRPLTDCSFFIQGAKCKRGTNCPYRHSDKARSTSSVCRQWQERRCTNLRCPLRHPGGKEGMKTSVSPPTHSECAGTAEALAQHVNKLAKHTQCPYCYRFFPSKRKYQEHKKLCAAQTASESTDRASVSSGSADLELLSETDSESTSGDEGYLPPHNVPSPTKVVTLSKKRHSSASVSGIGREMLQVDGSPLQKVHSTGSMGIGRSAVVKNVGSAAGSGVSFLVGSGISGMLGSSSGTETETSTTSGDNEYLNYSDDDDDDDDCEMSYQYSQSEMARLLSLNEQDMIYESRSEDEDEEEEGGEDKGDDLHALKPKGGNATATIGGETVKRKPRKKRKSKSAPGAPTDPPRVVQLEPVGVFWDIENCPVPLEKSAFALANKMRREFFEGKREAEFMCVCDITKERKEVTDELHKAQVTLVHVNAVAKNAADDKLRQSLRRFAHTYPPPSTVVLISGDVNFSPELNDLRHIHNISIILVHNQYASEALRVFAHQLISFEQFLEDVGPPREPQKSNPPGIVVVSGLPSHVPPKRISSRLDQLSDNCGGKVLRVDPHSRTARILFRTPEWAMKAQKRMGGEDVFGSKITVTLEAPPRQHHGSSFERLSGPNLSKSFPPSPQSPPPKQQHYPQHTPPPPQRIVPHLPPPPAPYGPGSPVAEPHPMRMPLRPMGMGLCPMGMPPPPNPHPVRFPQPPGAHSPPLFLHHNPPHIPPSHPPNPSHPPYAAHIAVQQPPRGPPPQGKILIFKLPPVSDTDLDRLNGHVVRMRLAASIKAEHVILWHNFSELQVLLRVDFHQTALVRRDELVRTMYERGELRPQVAQEFLDGCSRSLVEVCRREHVPWEVTTCGWSEDEEQDRITRSQVIALLRRYHPHYWMKWNNFKENYSQTYSSAISEMAIHVACKGAVQILGNPGKQQTQVIVFYELSPLVRIMNQPSSAQATVQKNVVHLLSSQPEKRIKLLDFVRVYHDTYGPLPVSANGKPLQEILTTTPSVTLVGGRPSSIHVTLMGPGAKVAGAPAQLPRNLTEIAAAFRHLLNHYPNSQLPLNQIQQEYQTFYHKSFRVSDYLSKDGARLRDLLEACEGIKLKEVLLPNGKVDAVVCMETESAQPQAVVALPIPPAAVKKFRQDCVKVLSAEQGHKVLLIRFHEAYLKQFGYQFSLSHYGAKKLINLFEAIPDTVKVTGDKEERVVELLQQDTQKDLEKRVEALLHNLPEFQVSLDHFMHEYEKMYGERLTHYYGHSKLINLLESMTDVVEIKGKGPARCIALRPSAKVFAHEMADLLADQPTGLPINKIVPAYKEKFGCDLVVSRYGFPKLIRALEAIQDTVEIQGTGPTRVVFLRRVRRGTGTKTSSSSSSLSSSPLLSDEVIAILMTTHGLKKSLLDLTKMYNRAFRTPANQHPISSEDMGEALKKLAIFKLSGSGPTQYVQLVQQSDAPEQPRENSPSMQSHAKDTREQEQDVVKPEVQHQTQVPLPAVKKEEQQLPEVAKSSVSIPVESPSKVVKQSQPAMQLDEKEAKRLSSETHRLLLCHQEHAMTLSELVECFRVGEDPASPSAEQLYLCLKNYNSKGGGNKGQNNFQISYISTSVADSMIQLNRPDCLWKLSRDLLYLFVYHPTADFSMPLDDLLAVYAECFGRKFVPAVYAAKKFQQLMGGKHMLKVMKLDQDGARCSLTDGGCRSVIASLLVELLFKRGEQCQKVDDLPVLYQEHFGVSLDVGCFGVTGVSDLLQLAEVSQVVEISKESGVARPVLTNTTLLAEQLRCLLTVHNGRLPINNLKEIYAAEFRVAQNNELSGLLDKNLLQLAPHVVNLAGQKWVVWAPTGRPYPPRRSKISCPGLFDGEMTTGTSILGEAAATGSDDVDRGLTHMPSDSGKDNTSGTDHKESTVETLKYADKHSGIHIVPAAKIELAGELEADPQLIPPLEAAPDFEIPPLIGGEPLSTGGTDHTNTDASQLQSSSVSSVQTASRRVSTPSSSPSINSQPRPSLDEIPIDPSPYGFLTPALIAELINHAKSLEDLEADDLPTVDSTENLLDLDYPAQHESQEDYQKHGHGNEGESEGTEESRTPPEKVDYLKKNMTPDEVLHEFRKLKDQCGGYLDPEKMDPFLTYFGELSGRELERLESLKVKPKGAARRKQMMAIRFPSQSPAPPPDPFSAQHQKDMQELERIERSLPVAPDLSNLSDSSDSEGSCPIPLSREEYIKKLLERGHPNVFSSDEERLESNPNQENKEENSRSYATRYDSFSSDFPTSADLPKPLLTIGDSHPSQTADPAQPPSEWPLLPGMMEYNELKTDMPSSRSPDWQHSPQ